MKGQENVEKNNIDNNPLDFSEVAIKSFSGVPTLTEVRAGGDGHFGVGEIVYLTATFSEAVTINRVRGLVLSIGNSRVTATLYHEGRTSLTHEFLYRVAAGHNADSVQVLSINLGHGSIVDSDNNSILSDTLPLTVNNMVVDTIAPTLTFDDDLGINSKNQLNYRVSGKCGETGEVIVTISGLSPI